MNISLVLKNKWGQVLWGAATGFSLLIAGATPAFSCACCAEPAERHIGSFALDEYLISELKALNFNSSAMVYTNACGFECVRGIENPQDQYQIKAGITDTTWQLDFSTPEGENGTLSFALPAEVFEFFVDRSPHIGDGGVYLYKELRLSVQPHGTGIFAAGLAGGAQAELILQGEGNLCTAAQDFTNWQLRVDGETARFAFYGGVGLPE